MFCVKLVLRLSDIGFLALARQETLSCNNSIIIRLEAVLHS